MTKTEELDILFKTWTGDDQEYIERFSRDGIINEYKFKGAKTKILFIAKEPNNPNGTTNYIDYWANELTDRFSKRLAAWAYGCLNNFPIPDLLPGNEELLDALQSVAFMNVKKIGGGSVANNAKIQSEIERHKEYLLHEINIINPEIIIGSIGYTYLWNILFDGIKFVESGYNVKVARINRYKLIEFYHPSARYPLSMTYCLLEKVITSKVFRGL